MRDSDRSEMYVTDSVWTGCQSQIALTERANGLAAEPKRSMSVGLFSVRRTSANRTKPARTWMI